MLVAAIVCIVAARVIALLAVRLAVIGSILGRVIAIGL